MTVTTSLGKSDNRFSIAQEFWKLQGEFVKKRYIQEGFSGFLKHVGFLIILVRLQLE